LQGHQTERRWAMSFEQIHTPSMEGPGTDEEALVQTPRAEAGKQWQVKLGIVGSVLLLGAASIFVVSPPGVTASSTRSDVAESIVSMASKYESFTSPYYFHGGLCPEGEGIVLKSDCTEAGNILGECRKTLQHLSEPKLSPGCRKDFKSVIWNPDLTGTATIFGSTSICKRLPKDMHDFAALQADQEAMTFHCLEEASAFATFKECMFQMKSWNLDRAWTEEEMTEQHKASNLVVNELANKKEEAEHSCWTKQDDKVAGETGVWHLNLLDAKMKCRTMGDECTAVSCYKKTGWSGVVLDACTPRGPAATFSDAPSSSRKYQVYTPCDGEAEETAEEAEEEKDDWTEHSSKYSGGYANGHGQKYDLAGAKAKCLTLSGCNAITCNQGLAICTVRASSTLKSSSNGEVSFTHNG